MIEPAARRAAMEPSALAHFDLIRGVAAFAVVVGHVRGLFLDDYDSAVHRGLAQKALYLVTGLGHQAVVVFFVLSGLFIGGSVLDASDERRWGWRPYLLNRFTRLYVVLLPALVATVVIDTIGMRLFGADGNVYGGHFASATLHLPDVRQTLSWPVFVGNALFLQSFYAPSLGSNGSLWSLSYEFWYYLLFPLAVRAVSRDERPARRACYVALAALILAAGGGRMAFYALVWGFGALVAFGWRAARSRLGGFGPLATQALVVASAGIAGVATLVARVRLVSQDVGDLLLGGATALLLLCLLVAGGARRAGVGAAAYQRFAALIAGFSYTLYLVHYPPILLLRAGFLGETRFAPSAPTWSLCFGLAFAVSIFYALPFSRVTEAQTARLRRWLSARFA